MPSGITGQEAALAALLKPEIRTQLDAKFGTPADAATTDKYAEAMGKAIANILIPFLVANVKVLPTNILDGNSLQCTGDGEIT